MKLPSSTAEEEEEVPEEQEQEPETEPEPIPEPVEELEPEPEPEANLDPILDLPPEADDTEPVLELKPETWAIKDSEEEAREEVRGEAEGCSDPKMAELCIQEGISTQQVKPVCSCVLLVKCSNMLPFRPLCFTNLFSSQAQSAIKSPQCALISCFSTWFI